MKIATWNVNSIRKRVENVCDWLDSSGVDVLCLQELKCTDEQFPRAPFEERGYAVETHGQKAYSGVALIAKGEIEDVSRGLPGDEEDEQARWIEGTVNGIRIASLYLPNGNPVDEDRKFGYKLRWMNRMIEHATGLMETGAPVVLAGDYNTIPRAVDCYDPAKLRGDALFHPDTLRRWQSLLNLGFTDAFDAHDGRPHRYSYWDYVRNRFDSDDGLRIDHLLLSPEAADLCEALTIDKDPRAEAEASDHTPVIGSFREAA
ncbi:MAG: exodeoxyribonuclease III [Alphaproteobacteria bacterium]